MVDILASAQVTVDRICSEYLNFTLGGAGRIALRAAIRARMNGDVTPTHVIDLERYVGSPVPPVNSWSRDELIAVGVLMGLDVRAMVAQAIAAKVETHAAGFVGQVEPTDTAPSEADTTHDTAIEADATIMRKALGRALGEGDFARVDNELRTLIRDARKPAVVITREVERVVYAPAPAESVAGIVPDAIGASTWAQIFGAPAGGANASRKVNLYAPHPLTPEVDSLYGFDEGVLHATMIAMKHEQNVWLFGPAGTGKSSFAEQLAARTGRPFVLIPCDDTTEAPELVGMTTPHQGSVRWQDGVLTAAIRIPHTIILIDEPTVARPGALMVLQSVLAGRVLSIKETGEVVRVAPGVRFLVADNTNGTGGGEAQGYEGTRRVNRATLDRFAMSLKMDYLPAAREAATVSARTGCTSALATLLVACASLTRSGNMVAPIGLRRVLAWATALTEGLPVRLAFEATVLNSAPYEDREPLEQHCALGLNPSHVAAALLGKDAPTSRPAPSPRGAEFQDDLGG